MHVSKRNREKSFKNICPGEFLKFNFIILSKFLYIMKVYYFHNEEDNQYIKTHCSHRPSSAEANIPQYSSSSTNISLHYSRAKLLPVNLYA